MCSGRCPKRYEPRLDGIVFSGILLCQLFRRLRARRCHIFYLVLWIQWLSCQRDYAILSRWQSLVLPWQCAPRRRHHGGLDCFLTLGEACVVTCVDGYTAAGDTENTSTCVFETELQSIVLEGFTHSGKMAPCDLSTLMPPSTVSHDCPNTVFGESGTANCSYGNAAISGTAAATVLTCGSDGALVSDPTFPYPTCGALTCPTGDLFLNGSLSVHFVQTAGDVTGTQVQTTAACHL